MTHEHTSQARETARVSALEETEAPSVPAAPLPYRRDARWIADTRWRACVALGDAVPPKRFEPWAHTLLSAARAMRTYARGWGRRSCRDSAGVPGCPPTGQPKAAAASLRELAQRLESIAAGDEFAQEPRGPGVLLGQLARVLAPQYANMRALRSIAPYSDLCRAIIEASSHCDRAAPMFSPPLPLP